MIIYVKFCIFFHWKFNDLWLNYYASLHLNSGCAFLCVSFFFFSVCRWNVLMNNYLQMAIDIDNSKLPFFSFLKGKSIKLRFAWVMLFFYSGFLSSSSSRQLYFLQALPAHYHPGRPRQRKSCAVYNDQRYSICLNHLFFWKVVQLSFSFFPFTIQYSCTG